MPNSVSVNFGYKKLAFWGHVLTQDGIAVDPSKVKAVQEWKQPTNMTEVRSFLGLAGYYRRFIEGFSTIAKPMTNYSRKIRSLNGPKPVRKVSKN